MYERELWFSVWCSLILLTTSFIKSSSIFFLLFSCFINSFYKSYKNILPIHSPFSLTFAVSFYLLFSFYFLYNIIHRVRVSRWMFWLLLFLNCFQAFVVLTKTQLISKPSCRCTLLLSVRIIKLILFLWDIINFKTHYPILSSL